jgi:four helix bundle protein
MNRFKELIVWQESMHLVTAIYAELKTFPSEELYGLSSQIRRSAISIPSNIAEGAGRNSPKEFCRFLTIANGSACELLTQLEIAFRLGFINEEAFNKLEKNLNFIRNMLWKLHASVMSTVNTVHEPDEAYDIATFNPSDFENEYKT